MSLSPINVGRISQNMQTNFILESLRRSQRNLFTSQTRIATGRSFVTPSENPIAAARVLDFSQAANQQRRFIANVQYGDSFLAAADSALAEVSSLVIDASVIASQTVSNLTSADERSSEAQVITAIRQQLQSVANREFNGRFIFGGRRTVDRPFVDALGGVAYLGDIGYLLTRVASDQASAISMPGNQVFGALSAQIATYVNLNPILRENARLDSLNGATESGILLGTLVFNEPEGAGVFLVDLSLADTVGDLADKINQSAQEAGSSLKASVGDVGLIIEPGSAVTISDRSGGSIVASLGLLRTELTTEKIEGADLGPRLTRLTPVGDLAGGEGIDLESGLIITNGGRTATIDLSTAETVQDIINTMNSAGVFITARISEDGTRLDVFNQVSGSSLTIGENGGTTATDLGIRTFDMATPLSDLNFGVGVTSVEGVDDFQIVARDGSTVNVNIDGALTVGDVIAAINDAAQDASVSIEARFTDTNNGIRIIDSTSGSGNLSVGLLNVSPAAVQLGINQIVTDPDADLIGDDVNPTRTDGVLGALIDLENALRNDDTQGITAAAGRLDQLRNDLVRQQGVIGARSQAMGQRRRQLEDAAALTATFLSEIQDLDYAEAATKLQQSLVQFQASLQVGSTLLNLSIMDFLR